MLHKGFGSYLIENTVFRSDGPIGYVAEENNHYLLWVAQHS